MGAKVGSRDTRFVELGRFLCELRAGQYWRLETLESFDEFLARRFPESKRKVYYLMSIHEHLPPQARKAVKEVGWTKGLELAKVAKEGWAGVRLCNLAAQSAFTAKGSVQARGGEGTYRAGIGTVGDYLVQAVQDPDLGGRAAIETATLMLETDKSRGYCLEMICADFPAGANLDNEEPAMLLQSMSRFFKSLPGEQRQVFLHEVAEKAS